MPRPRNEKIITYDKDDKRTITFKGKDIEAEIPVEIGDTGMCYAKREYAKKKAIILILRD